MGLHDFYTSYKQCNEPPAPNVSIVMIFMENLIASANVKLRTSPKSLVRHHAGLDAIVERRIYGM